MVAECVKHNGTAIPLRQESMNEKETSGLGIHTLAGDVWPIRLSLPCVLTIIWSIAVRVEGFDVNVLPHANS
jgi:hypothetical protein